MPASHHVAFAFHHGFEAGAGGIVLLALTYFGIEHVGTRKEFGLGGAGIRHVTVMPVSLSSARSANENESRNALLAL